MIRRAAALFALVAFAGAWIVGVWCGHSPLVRLKSAGLALGFGFVAGIGVAIALQKIVLARLAERWSDLGGVAPSAAGDVKRPPPRGANARDDKNREERR